MKKTVTASLLIALLCAGCALAQSRKGKTTREQLTTATAIAIMRKMRDQLNDPDSLKVASVVYYESEPDVHALCVVFRAKNEQGGLVLQSFIHDALDDGSSGGFNNDVFWTIVCKGPIVLDATDAVKAALKADREKE
jgi:hypothetical protein